MAEEGNCHAFAKLLVDKKAHHLALAKRADHAKRGLAPLAVDVAAIIGLAAFKKAAQKRVVERAVDRRHPVPLAERGIGAKFPVADMGADKNGPVFQFPQILQPLEFDAAKTDHSVDMRKLANDAAEIAPHAGKNASLLGDAKVRHRKGEVPRRAPVPWGEGADEAEQAAEQRACRRHRQKTCKAEQKQHQRRLQRPDEDPPQSAQDDFPDRVSHSRSRRSNGRLMRARKSVSLSMSSVTGKHGDAGRQSEGRRIQSFWVVIISAPWRCASS